MVVIAHLGIPRVQGCPLYSFHTAVGFSRLSTALRVHLFAPQRVCGRANSKGVGYHVRFSDALDRSRIMSLDWCSRPSMSRRSKHVYKLATYRYWRRRVRAGI